MKRNHYHVVIYYYITGEGACPVRGTRDLSLLEYDVAHTSVSLGFTLTDNHRGRLQFYVVGFHGNRSNTRPRRGVTGRRGLDLFLYAVVLRLLSKTDSYDV